MRRVVAPLVVATGALVLALAVPGSPVGADEGGSQTLTTSAEDGPNLLVRAVPVLVVVAIVAVVVVARRRRRSAT